MLSLYGIFWAWLAISCALFVLTLLKSGLFIEIVNPDFLRRFRHLSMGSKLIVFIVGLVILILIFLDHCLWPYPPKLKNWWKNWIEFEDENNSITKLNLS